MAMWDFKHSFGKSIGTMHVIEITAGRTETGITGKRTPAEMIAMIAGIHGSVFRISAVENFLDFRDNNRAK